MASPEIIYIPWKAPLPPLERLLGINQRGFHGAAPGPFCHHCPQKAAGRRLPYFESHPFSRRPAVPSGHPEPLRPALHPLPPRPASGTMAFLVRVHSMLLYYLQQAGRPSQPFPKGIPSLWDPDLDTERPFHAVESPRAAVCRSIYRHMYR